MRILLVEPDAVLAHAIEEAFLQEGYVPLVVGDAATAERLVAEGEYHVGILDEELARGACLTLCKTLRDSGTAPFVVLLSTRSELEHRVACLRCGADEILVRPFAIAELVARVVAISRHLTHRVVYGELKLDLVKRIAEYDGAPITFTNREFELLAYFMQHADEVLSREVLAAKVWNTLFDTGTNVVDVYVTYLRRKLGVLGPQLIHTVRGRGYCFGRSLPQVSNA